MKRVLSCLVRCAYHAGTRDLYPALAALVGPVQNIFFLALHSFSSFVPIAQKAGQAVVPDRLYGNMCLWYFFFTYQERNIGFLIHVSEY
jgi:hypothetical protein